MREALTVWGGWSGYEPEKCASIIASMLKKDGFKIRMETSTRAFADPSLTQLSLIVPIYTMSMIEKDEVATLSQAIHGGMGLAGYHGGMGDAFVKRSSTSSCAADNSWLTPATSSIMGSM